MEREVITGRVINTHTTLEEKLEYGDFNSGEDEQEREHEKNL